MTDPQAPDGRWGHVVSALTSDGSVTKPMWLAAVDGGAARRLDIHFRRRSALVADGKLLGLSERPRNGERDDDKASANFGQSPRRRSHAISDAPGGVSDFEWSRDGRVIASLA